MHLCMQFLGRFGVSVKEGFKKRVKEKSGKQKESVSPNKASRYSPKMQKNKIFVKLDKFHTRHCERYRIDFL